MNQLSTVIAPQVPTKIEDLQKFVLIGREKLVAVRAEIRAIEKLEIATGVREQKKEEAQLLASALLDAEARIGEILKALPTAQGQRTDILNTSLPRSNEVKPKEKVIAEMGFNKKQVCHFETLAENKDIIEQVKQEAFENDELPTRTEVLRRVKERETETQKPHVAFNSGNNEWYTPSEYIEAARSVMGEIELDPASCELANRTVRAGRFFTAQDDGLRQEWSGRVWMNPPYASELIGQFCSKFTEHYSKGDIKEAIVLVNNATETTWFNVLIEQASAVIFPKGRVKFKTPNGEMGAPLQGQAVIYFGDNPGMFMKHFEPFGWGAFL